MCGQSSTLDFYLEPFFLVFLYIRNHRRPCLISAVLCFGGVFILSFYDNGRGDKRGLTCIRL